MKTMYMARAFWGGSVRAIECERVTDKSCLVDGRWIRKAGSLPIFDTEKKAWAWLVGSKAAEVIHAENALSNREIELKALKLEARRAGYTFG